MLLAKEQLFNCRHGLIITFHHWNVTSVTENIVVVFSSNIKAFNSCKINYVFIKYLHLLQTSLNESFLEQLALYTDEPNGKCDIVSDIDTL